MHLIPSHQGRPSDDPIFALNKEATAAPRRAASRSSTRRSARSSTTTASSPSCPTRRARRARGAGRSSGRRTRPSRARPTFLRAVIDDLLAASPSSPQTADRRRDARRHRRAAPRHRELPRAGAVAAHDELVLGAVPDALRRGRPQGSRRSRCSTRDGGLDVAALDARARQAARARRGAPSSSSTTPATTRRATR